MLTYLGICIFCSFLMINAFTYILRLLFVPAPIGNRRQQGGHPTSGNQIFPYKLTAATTYLYLWLASKIYLLNPVLENNLQFKKHYE